ncbi:MAG: hypothetical protein P8075_01100 [Deltaproteobacteria bacterium]
MKREQKILSKKASGDGIMGGALLLGLTIILFIALLGLVSPPALAKGHGRHIKRACSQTASAAFFACYNEKKDDYWIAQGNCFNLDDPGDRAECFAEAKADYKDAKAECQDQLGARRDLCDELGEAPYDPEIDPDNFVDPADIGGSVTANPYFPLVRGSKWVYKTSVRGEGITETNTDEVLTETKKIMGVECVIVHDIVYDGDNTDPDNIKEDTYDYYAQNTDGNVWYFGEFSLSVEEELPSMEGSWLFGVDDAKPGIIMYADLSEKDIGKVYRQEFALGDAEDWAKLENLDAEARVPYSGGNCLVGDQCRNTSEGTPLEPDVIEYKYYKSGIGTVLEYAPDTGERTALIRFAPGP